MPKPQIQSPVTEVKTCYKFIENVKIGNTIYKRGECIKLDVSELELYGPYVAKCHGEKTESSTGECKTC